MRKVALHGDPHIPVGGLQNDIDLDGLVELICIDLRNKLDWMEANILMPAAV